MDDCEPTTLTRIRSSLSVVPVNATADTRKTTRGRTAPQWRALIHYRLELWLLERRAIEGKHLRPPCNSRRSLSENVVARSGIRIDASVMRNEQAELWRAYAAEQLRYAEWSAIVGTVAGRCVNYRIAANFKKPAPTPTLVIVSALLVPSITSG